MRTSELSSQAGVSRRALRLYESRGLIDPPRSRDNGYRVYDRETVERIHTIRLLQTIGFSLAEVARIIGTERVDWRETLEVQERLLARRQADLADALAQVRTTLAQLRSGRLAGDGAVLALIAAASNDKDMTAMQDEIMSHYNDKARDQLANHPATPAEIQLGQSAWTAIYAEIGEMMAAGTDPASPQGLALVRRMDALIMAFTLGDPDVTAGLNRLWSNPDNAKRMLQARPMGGPGTTPEEAQAIFDYVARMRAAAAKAA